MKWQKPARLGVAVFGIALSRDGEVAASGCFVRYVRLMDGSGVGQ